MSESYEKLEGAAGRGRNFRSPRFSGHDVFSNDPPTVWFGDESFRLSNISSSGVGCRGEVASDALPGAKDLLRLTQRGKELFSADAVLARRQDTPNGEFLGISLESGIFDLDALRVGNARASAQDALSSYVVEDVPADYKEFCADTLRFLNDCRANIDRYYGSIEVTLSDVQRCDIAIELAEASRQHWIDLLLEGNRFALKFHGEKKFRKRAKSFTEKTVTPALLNGEGWARSYYKPLGYPGDYCIMNYIYDGAPVGRSIYEKFLHLLSLIGANPIKLRMQYLSRVLSERACAAPSDSFRILSIGAGSARELIGLDRTAIENKKIIATLIDQEPDALQSAVSAVRVNFNQDEISVEAQNTSFKTMLNPAANGAMLAEHDVIYSAGLVDYLNPLLAQRFVQRVYQYLKPGGQLIIGNLSDDSQGMIWPCEYVTDWTLYFRSDEEMLDMARQVPCARLSLDKGAGPAIHFLTIEKPLEA